MDVEFKIAYGVAGRNILHYGEKYMYKPDHIQMCSPTCYKICHLNFNLLQIFLIMKMVVIKMPLTFFVLLLLCFKFKSPCINVAIAYSLNYVTDMFVLIVSRPKGKS